MGIATAKSEKEEEGRPFKAQRAKAPKERLTLGAEEFVDDNL